MLKLGVVPVSDLDLDHKASASFGRSFVKTASCKPMATDTHVLCTCKIYIYIYYYVYYIYIYIHILAHCTHTHTSVRYPAIDQYLPLMESWPNTARCNKFL